MLLDNITSEDEYRVKIGHIIYVTSVSLNYSNEIAAKGVIIMHRYMNHLKNSNVSHTTEDSITLIRAILFLVGKLNEEVRTLRDIINVTSYYLLDIQPDDLDLSSERLLTYSLVYYSSNLLTYYF